MVRESPFQSEWEFDTTAAVISVGITPDGSRVVAGNVRRQVHLIGSDGCALWPEPPELDHEVWAVAISEDGQTIAAGTACKKPSAGSLYVFDGSGREIWHMKLDAPIWSIAFSRDGRSIAASTWANTLHWFDRTESGEFKERFTHRVDEARGLYGVKFAKGDSAVVGAAYDHGLFCLDNAGTAIDMNPTTEHDRGIYCLSVSRTSGDVFAALRDGGFLVAPSPVDQNNGPSPWQVCGRIGSRPSCGIAATDDGQVVAISSFDGCLYLCSRDGTPFWSYRTEGEAWSTAISADGSLVCVGSGDHRVRLFGNEITSAAVLEIRANEQTLSREATHIDRRDALSRLGDLYLRYGLVEYGIETLTSTSESLLPRYVLVEAVESLLTKHIEHFKGASTSHFRLAELLSDKPDELLRAARHFQLAAEDPRWRARALSEAAKCFSGLNLHTAMSASFKRARQTELDAVTQFTLYNLGRSYEDLGNFADAARHYELIVAWNVRYRDTWSRLEKLLSLQDWDRREREWERVDYTGLTASYLGPDAPDIDNSQVDEILKPVTAARTVGEISIDPDERARLEELTAELADDPEYLPRAADSELGYTFQAFLKYDYASPEDQVKKYLETMTLLSLVDHLDLRRSLDVGSATGRYPLLFSKRGVQATGLDRSPEAIEYAKSKVQSEDGPEFVLGEAESLPFESDTFDLVTCMMGTFAHIPPESHPKVAEEFLRVLRPGGRLIVSTWDVEADHLGYLTMYSDSEREVIRRNSRTRDEMVALLAEAGGNDPATRSFCVLPDAIVSGLGLGNLSTQDLRIALRADLAARIPSADTHGEMFIAFCDKAHMG